ncbi:MAG: DUF4857 domain-containing protein [Bacteroidales bacterium]
MKNRLPIYIITLLIVTVSAYVFVPPLVSRVIYKPIDVPFLQYSSIVKDFIAIDFREESPLKSVSGKCFQAEDYDSILPLFNYRQLAMDGKLPICIDGDTLDLQRLQEKNISGSFRPKYYNMPTIDLNLLFEANNAKVSFTTPDDVMRISDKVEFILAETNTLDKAKGELFTSALERGGFTFPAKFVEGNNSVKKSYDQGFFIADANNALFHMMMIDGKPYVKRVRLPKDVIPRHFIMMEQADQRFYGMLFDENGGTYIIQRGDFDDNTYVDENFEQTLSGACDTSAADCASCGGCSAGAIPTNRPLANGSDYQLVKLDIANFDVENDSYSLFGNALYWTFSITSETGRKVFALDRESLQSIQEYSIDFPESRVEAVFKYILPFSVELYHGNSSYVAPTIGFNGWLAFVVNILFALLTLLIYRKRGRFAIYSAAYVMLFGVLGLIAVVVTPVALNNKFNA